MCRLPLRDPCCHLRIILGELAKLPQDVLLRRAGRFGDQRRGPEQLPRRVPSALDLQDPAHLSALRHVEGDEHDHPSGKDSPEREKMWTHETKVRLALVERKHGAPHRLRVREGPMTFLP